MLASVKATGARLRALAVGGAATATGDPQLPQLAAALEQGRAAVLGRLAQGLVALSQAQPGAAAELLIRQVILTHAVGKAQLGAAPKGALLALAGRPTAGHPGRRSSRRVAALRLALTHKRSKKAKLLGGAQAELSDLRLQYLLPAALEIPGIADAVQAALSAQLEWDAGLLEDLELSFSGRPAADVRRLRLVHRAAPRRGRALARKLLDARPKEALRAQIYECLADDPEALSLLLEGAKRGPFFARAAALAALARREEPEAKEGLLAALAEPGPNPLLLFQHALPNFRAPELIGALQERLRAEMRRDVKESARVMWATMLARTSFNRAPPWMAIGREPSAESVALLCQAFEEGWAPFKASRVAIWCAPLPALERLLMTEALRRAPKSYDHESWRQRVDLILVGAARLAPERFYELLAEDLVREGFLLQEAIRAWRGAENWREGVGEFRPGYKARPLSSFAGARPPAPTAPHPNMVPIRWDRRWVADAMRHERVEVVVALAAPGDVAVGAWLGSHFEAWSSGAQVKLRAWSTAEAVQAIACLKRIGAPERSRALLALLSSLFERGRSMRSHFEERSIETLLGYTEPEDLGQLQAWLTGAGAPLHHEWQREAVEARVRALGSSGLLARLQANLLARRAVAARAASLCVGLRGRGSFARILHPLRMLLAIASLPA